MSKTNVSVHIDSVAVLLVLAPEVVDFEHVEVAGKNAHEIGKDENIDNATHSDVQKLARLHKTVQKDREVVWALFDAPKTACHK